MKTKVQDVMTRELVTVGESTPFTEIVELLARNRISAVLALDAVGHVAGRARQGGRHGGTPADDQPGSHHRAGCSCGGVDCAPCRSTCPR